ncbi:MAG: SMC-Scp complex subunit ScpB [Halieaceae bacterium]|nr:SMC-Scp complex subunit ScpB [Halieaceae bacterium]
MTDAADTTGLVQILEGAILAAGRPLTVQNMADLFEEHERPANTEIREALKQVAERCEDRGFELQEVASGFRFQVRQQLSPWIGRLWTERPAKYSRALLETLSLIAYRQPITRGEIEEIRGVAVSSNIIKTLHERDWIRVVGHRDVPGRPAMYATTRAFLDYFNLKNLDQLPALAEIRDFDTLTAELGFEPIPELSEASADVEAGEGDSEAPAEGEALAEVVEDDAEGEETLSVDALRAAAESAADSSVEEPSAQQEEPSAQQEEPSAQQEEPSAQQEEPSAREEPRDQGHG